MRATTFGAYGKEPFSVHARFEGDSGSFSDLGDHRRRGYTEKICFPYKPVPVPKTSVYRTPPRMRVDSKHRNVGFLALSGR